MIQKRSIFTALLALILSISFSAGVFAAAKPAAKKTLTTYKGIVIDQHCSGTKDPTIHTKVCTTMPSCAKSGYGLDIKQKDGSYKFYKFDTNGQKLAKDFLSKTTRENNLAVIITGTLKGNVLTVSALTEDKTVPVITAQNVTLTGILIDTDCSGTKNPEAHTKECNLMPNCAASGYGIDVKQKDGSYKFYRFDASGEKLAKTEILDKTAKTNDLEITVKGTWDGKTLKVTAIEEVKAPDFEGVLIDEHCFKNIKDPTLDTKMCLTMESCAASGYGIAIKQKDDTYQFYKFDDKGQTLAADVLKRTVKETDIVLAVFGSLDGEVIKVTSLNEK